MLPQHKNNVVCVCLCGHETQFGCDFYDDVLDHPNAVYCFELILITFNFGNDMTLIRKQPLFVLLRLAFSYFFLLLLFFLEDFIFSTLFCFASHGCVYIQQSHERNERIIVQNIGIFPLVFGDTKRSIFFVNRSSSERYIIST